MGGKPLARPGQHLIQGELAADTVRKAWSRTGRTPPTGAPPRVGESAHEMFLIRPTTRPSTRTSRLQIGSMVTFSGCSRT